MKWLAALTGRPLRRHDPENERAKREHQDLVQRLEDELLRHRLDLEAGVWNRSPPPKEPTT